MLVSTFSVIGFATHLRAYGASTGPSSNLAVMLRTFHVSRPFSEWYLELAHCQSCTPSKGESGQPKLWGCEFEHDVRWDLGQDVANKEHA